MGNRHTAGLGLAAYDPDTLAALVYLTGAGILVAGRSDTILNTLLTESEI